jgi:hypothetical protein
MDRIYGNAEKIRLHVEYDGSIEYVLTTLGKVDRKMGSFLYIIDEPMYLDKGAILQIRK